VVIAADLKWNAAYERSTASRTALEPALLLVELVASPAVRDAAAELRDLAYEAGSHSFAHAAAGVHDPKAGELWRIGQEAEDAVRDAEAVLRTAIQTELELDR
jgi:hypothetical protein